jgi:multidrug efflux pump subunit AcrA (membrane-fusion protein)
MREIKKMKTIKMSIGQRTPMRSTFVLMSVLFIMAGCGAKKSEQIQTTSPATKIEPAQVFGIGRIEPELKILELTSETTGIIKAINFQPGQMVSQGQKIIELTNDIEQAQLAQAAAKIKVQLSEIEAAQARLAGAKIKADNAKANFERAKNLFDQNAEAERTFDDARAEYESLVQQVKQLEADVATAQNLLKQHQAAYQLGQAELNRKFIAAPTDGQILSLDVTIGSLISMGQVFGTFAPKSALSAWCEIDELFAPQVQINQKAYVRSQGMADTLAWGRVSFVGPYLRKKSIFADDVGALEDRRVREVRILLDPQAEILYGTRVECVIFIDREK